MTNINNNNGIKIGNNRGNSTIATIVQKKTKPLKIKIPMPLNTKKSSADTQINTTVATKIPIKPAEIAIEIPSTGSSTCQISTSANITSKVIKITFFVELLE